MQSTSRSLVLGILLLSVSTRYGYAATSPCDINHDGVVDQNDVQLAISASLGLGACVADLDGNGHCDVIDVQRIINAALGGVCRITGSMGPLTLLASNPRYFATASGQVVFLTGSHTWNDFQDTDLSVSPAAFDFNSYVTFLKAHGHNVTILWKKDLPTYSWNGPGGTWHMTLHPWQRTGGANGQIASDGLPAFDLSKFNQPYFDRLRARVLQLQQNGIYAIVELFDGLGISNGRSSGDGYPFTGNPTGGQNNVNGVDDGYTGGVSGIASMTMTSPNAITAMHDAYVQKAIDTLYDLPNVLWEISEEAPDNSTWWQNHMIALIHSYEFNTYGVTHPVGYPRLNVAGSDNATLFNSNADWVAPGGPGAVNSIAGISNSGTGNPSHKVVINDSDHSYYGMWNDSAQVNRNYIWENFTNGAQVIFMDPYNMYWASSNRNLCGSPTNGVCTTVDPRWNNFRDNLGYTLAYANRLDLAKVTPQPGLSSTGFCMADAASTGSEYLVYAPSGGSFTVNLSATTKTLNVEWFNPSTGATTTAGTVTGGSSSQAFTPPFSGDAVLYLVDSAGHA